ncbi:MAG: AAA family ATPase [Chitinophagaceae bacterium]|nr:MAG: AAA family ATPase [Chitinophagaceae bacterium]
MISKLLQWLFGRKKRRPVKRTDRRPAPDPIELKPTPEPAVSAITEPLPATGQEAALEEKSDEPRVQEEVATEEIPEVPRYLEEEVVENEPDFRSLVTELVPFESGTETLEQKDKKEVMETHQQQDDYVRQSLPVEFDYLESLISHRLGKRARPSFPIVDTWALPLKDYIFKYGLSEDKTACTILLIALAPHAYPALLDAAIEKKIENSGDFPDIGGVRVNNFRGFLPTGQTAIFIIAGDDWQERTRVEKFFWSDNTLSMKKILWLDELPQGEPVMSGKIIMARDYVDLFLFGLAAPPKFSTSFPAKKITSELRPDDIVMSREVKRHFRNLEEWINHNDTLMSDWDMDKRLRQGYRALFYGPPGTGKTLTATILGNQTGKEVYKIDLAMLVSKYIGETEKNLELLFARAEDKDWILFFDEADAIFGKRTSVRDAHDKYANQEVSYLLQRIEDYNGMVILATNMKNNIDDAFIRRFNDIVRFTMPGEEERAGIWTKSFPDDAEFGDIPQKVKKYDISGGNIINVIHYAGIQAVKKQAVSENEYYDGFSKEPGIDPETIPEYVRPVKLRYDLDDIVEGIKREMLKEGRPLV